MTIVAFLALAFAPILSAQSLLPEKSEEQIALERLDQDRIQTVNFVESKLRLMYQRMNTEGKQQAYFDLLGTKGAAAIQWYAAGRAWVLLAKPSTTLPAPDPERYSIAQDGKVTYIAPPEPPTPPNLNDPQ